MWYKKENIVGIIAYITPVGFLIAALMNMNRHSTDKQFGAFHLRQAFGLYSIAILFYFALSVSGKLFPFLGGIWRIVDFIITIFTITASIDGALSASKHIKKPIIIIGKMIDEKLGRTFE